MTTTRAELARAPGGAEAGPRAWLDLALGGSFAVRWWLDVAIGRLFWDDTSAGLIPGLFDGPTPASPSDLARAVHDQDADLVADLFARLESVDDAAAPVRVGPSDRPRRLSLRGRVTDRDEQGRPRRVIGLLLDEGLGSTGSVPDPVRIDDLTGVANRRSFEQAVRGEWRRARRSREPVSLALIDIDRFALFNLTYGSHAGDEVLRVLARSLDAEVRREGDLVARFAGDRFVVLLPHTDDRGALSVVRRMAEAGRSLVVRSARAHRVAVSVGFSTWHPDDGVTSADTVLAQAAKALQVAKDAGGGQVVGYAESLAADDAILDEIRNGLTRGEFELFYQPLINLGGGSVAGFEALARWRHPHRGLLSPDHFIPVAERSDLICDFGRWALEEAVGQLARLSGAEPALRDAWVAVNLSARHISVPSVVQDVQSALLGGGLSPHRLEVEVTETALVTGDGRAEHLSSLRELGVGVAIDDFGTGYTSIGQLPHLSADVLKIDRSFIASQDRRNSELIRLMIGAAQAFDLRVVAEGVEQEETLTSLRTLGCHQAQGFVIARPMPADEIPTWLHGYEQGRVFRRLREA